MSRDLGILALALLTWGIGEGMFFYFQPLYLQQLGADPLLIGAIIGGIGLAMTLVHLPAGYIADRYGRRPLLYAGWIIGLLATWIMALAPSLAVFVSGSVLYGLTYFVMVPLNSYVTAARGRWSVGRAITLISASFNLGGVLGPLIGGWIGEQVGLQRTFLVAACLFVVSTAIIFLIRAQPVEAASHSSFTTSLSGALNRRILSYLGVVFLAMFVIYLPQPLSQNFLQNERGLDLTQIGQLLSAAGVGVVIFNLVLGQLNARLGFLLGQAAMACFALLLLVGQAFPWYLAAYFLLGSYKTVRSLATAQGRALIDPSKMGLAYGLIETAGSSAIILAPPLAGWLYARNPAWVYAASLGLILLVLAFNIRYHPLRAEEIL